MEEIYAGGRVKAIGVSNFQPPTCATLFAASEVRPAVNQVEVSPFLAQDEIRAFDAEHGIVTEAWSPIARGKVADDPVIQRDRASSSAAPPPRSTLRWHVQRGDVVFPKSVKRCADGGELRDLRLRARRVRDGRDLRASTAASAPARTRTSSTGSRADGVSRTAR